MTTEHPDLTPAAEALARLIEDTSDDQLGAPTPCDGTLVADLIDHVDGFSLAFAAAAAKDLDAGSQPPSADGSRLAPDWRTRIPVRLAALAAAWRDQDAWTGMTRAGGLDLPAEVAGRVAADEVVVHGWDLARATGRDYPGDDGAVRAALEFVGPTVAGSPDGTPGLFGPPVAVPDQAPLLDRLLGLTGRDPGWRPGG